MSLSPNRDLRPIKLTTHVVETDQGWLNLATVLDLYSRRIVGWAMNDHLRAELPFAALRMAISAKRPGAGLIHHSDRGVQYASEDYRKLMQSAGFKASMSRKADCYDNPPDGELLSHAQNRAGSSLAICNTYGSQT